MPEYELIDSYDSHDYGIASYFASISTDSLREEALRAIAEDVAAQLGGYDQALVFVYEEVLEPYDPLPNSPNPLKSSVDGSDLRPSATITIELYNDRYRIVYPPVPFSEVVAP